MQYLFNEEIAYQDAPGGCGVGVSSVGPAIMMYGNQEQQRRYLPRIANAEDRWAALYSEPGAGADLASIQTRAVRDGDEYVINGLKTWVAGADRASMGWLAARTDPNAPKHRGLSTFAVSMDDPGIEIRPIENLAGERQLSEVALHNVRVPADQRVGPEHRGWYHIASTLDFERSGVAAFARGKRHVEQLGGLAKEDSTLAEQRRLVRYELAGPLDRAPGRLQRRPAHPLAADAGHLAELRGLDLESLRLGAQPAHRRHRRAPARHGRPALARRQRRPRRRRLRPPLPDLGRQHHRRRHVRDPAQHHRPARPWPPAIATAGDVKPIRGRTHSRA